MEQTQETKSYKELSEDRKGLERPGTPHDELVEPLNPFLLH